MTTKGYAFGVKQHGWNPLPTLLWQRNCYERITRDYQSLNQIPHYIAQNSLQWHLARKSPNAIVADDR